MEALQKPVLIAFGPGSTLAPKAQGRELDRLAAELEKRVPGSTGHARRVALYAAGAAKRMGLDREEIARVRRAAALHDIGKVETAAEIVNKPGPLSEAEFSVVRRHAAVGARMVAGLGDAELAAIIRHHHERLDGGGYPDGLEGEEIPLGARIVAVADTFDAVASTRPYRPAKRHREALALLDAEAGAQLDPDVVRAFEGYFSGLHGVLPRILAFWPSRPGSFDSRGRADAYLSGNSGRSTMAPSGATTIARRRSCPICGGEGEPIPRYRKVELDCCQRCGQIFLGHAEVSDLRSMYVGDEYVDSHDDYLAEDLSFRHIAKQRIGWLSRRVSPGPLLELGPGRGYLLDAARNAGFDPLGVEPSPVLAERIRSDFGVAVECGFVDEVELPRRHFEGICLYHVFEHVEDPVPMLELLGELLSDDGLLVIEVPNFACAMAQRRGERWGAVQLRDLHVSQFTPRTLEQAANRAGGIDVVAVDTVSPWHYLPPSRRLRPRALAGFGYRMAGLRTLRSTHPSGFDNLRLLASAAGRG